MIKTGLTQPSAPVERAAKVGAPAKAGAPAAPHRAVALQKTPAQVSELRAALDRAHRKMFGSSASPQALDVLTAQVSLETGSGTSMYNYNFGGIKGAGPTGKTAVARTKEVLGGKTVEIRDGFRAYDSIDDGAADYLGLLRDRFGPALDAARRGDVDGFAAKLKRGGYYTASEEDYARALRALTGAADSARAEPRRGAASGYATSAEISRIADAMSVADFSEVLGPSPLGGPSHRPKRERDDEED